VADSDTSLLVLGLGNVLCGDDGLGIVAVHELERLYRPADGVRLVDGGTLGLSLLSIFQGSQEVIIVDAIHADGPPGSLVRLEGDDVAPAVRTRLSVHQIGVADLLDGLRLLDAYPRRLILLGLVPATMDLGLERSNAIDANLGALIDAVIAEIRRLGYEMTPRPDDAPHRTDSRGLVDGPVSLQR
jgi:hydrogenase maturation protease